VPSCRRKNLEFLDSDRTKHQRIKPSIPNIPPKSQAWDPRSLVLWFAAKQEAILPRQLSFVSACQYILSNWDLSCFSALKPDKLLRQILRCISQCRVGCRPGRFAHRCVMRRRDQYKLMMTNCERGSAREIIRLREKVYVSRPVPFVTGSH
jgi:hypothetical protein